MRVVKAIVPAAGLSSRFGGPNKMLADWNGQTLIRSTVAAIAKCGIEVIVVTGRDANEVAAQCKEAKCAFNPNFALGLGTSLSVGVKASGECDGFLIALGDMPDIRTEVVEELIAQFQTAEPGSIIAPVYAVEPDRVGHPILFCSSYRSKLEALAGDEGARSIIQHSLNRLIQIQVSGALHDFDNPAT
ncbi:MAG: nucleotidyltransferase family protein [Fimbriimonadaceae bacterium]